MNIDLLKRLCETPGVASREERVRELIEREAQGLFDEMTVDPMGSLHCRLHPAGGRTDDTKTVMLLCHMDEIGFLVSHVCEKGFIHVDPVGGFDPRNLFSRRVLVCTDQGDFQGVMNAAGKPIHVQTAEESKKVPDIDTFFIDLGMGAKTAEKVQVGDFVVMDEPLLDLPDKVVSKALDNRVACWLGLEVIRKLKQDGKPHDCEIHVVFTTQEEVGLRGAWTSSFAVAPDVGIGVDVTLSCDTPGVPEHQAITTQGKGFGLEVKDAAFISDIGLVREFEALARAGNIPFQRTILGRGGQDGAAAQQSGRGAKAVGIVVGCRYVHTVTEMVDKTDLMAARDILTAYLAAN